MICFIVNIYSIVGQLVERL